MEFVCLGSKVVGFKTVICEIVRAFVCLPLAWGGWFRLSSGNERTVTFLYLPISLKKKITLPLLTKKIYFQTLKTQQQSVLIY